MNKVILYGIIFCAGVATALTVFRSSTTYTGVGSTLTVTNVAQTAWLPSSVEWSFASPFTGDCSISRVRDTTTNLLVKVSIFAAHNVYMNGGEFEGTWVVAGDKLIMSQPGATNATITLTTEEMR